MTDDVEVSLSPGVSSNGSFRGVKSSSTRITNLALCGKARSLHSVPCVYERARVTEYYTEEPEEGKQNKKKKDAKQRIAETYPRSPHRGYGCRWHTD